MIEAPPLLTIRRPARRPDDAQIAAFQGVPTGFVIDAMGGRGALDKAIKPLAPDRLPNHVAGPALTAGNAASGIMATLGALNFVQAGDVLVAGVEGFQGCAAAGDRLVGMARNCGAAGFVSDGPMRDYQGLVDAGLPCWCSGLTPNSPYGNGPGTVGLPISLGGMQVDTGDMIVADRDGVVVVPFERIDAVIAALGKVRELEKALDARVADGLAVPDDVRGWLDAPTTRFVE